MSQRGWLHLGVFVFLFCIPSVSSAASIPFLGPIIPQDYNVCPAGWGMVIDVINNIFRLLITLLLVAVAPLMIAYAGFRFLTSGANPGARAEARKILFNLFGGILVALMAWMIVAALMTVLYRPSDPKYATRYDWTSLIIFGSTDKCIDIAAGWNPRISKDPFTGITPGGTPVVGGTAGGPCADGNTACSPGAIKGGAQALGLSLSDTEAAAMSCIAMTESSGNPKTPDSSTGACGTFQITNRPGNWSNPAYHRGACSTASSCNDATCNLQTALLMFQASGYQPWTGQSKTGEVWNQNARACVQKYDPGTTRRIK